MLRARAGVVGTPAWVDETLRAFTPTVASDEWTRAWWRRWLLASSSPGAVMALGRMNVQIDVRHALPAIRVPTRLIQRRGDDPDYTGAGRYIVDHIEGAELVELDSVDHGWWHDSDRIVAEIEPFLRGIWASGEWDAVETDRVLATVLFTDIVDSTARLAELGDRRWRDHLQQHHAVVRRQLTRFSGREIDTAGDGFFASFDGPARAIRCATAICQAVSALGIEIRAGLHTGECEVVGGKIGGIAVHIGARIASQAGAGEVLASSTVKDLVAGSGIEFRERGIAQLKGVPGEWRLYAVETPSDGARKPHQVGE